MNGQVSPLNGSPVIQPRTGAREGSPTVQGRVVNTSPGTRGRSNTTTPSPLNTSFALLINSDPIFKEKLEKRLSKIDPSKEETNGKTESPKESISEKRLSDESKGKRLSDESNKGANPLSLFSQIKKLTIGRKKGERLSPTSLAKEEEKNSSEEVKENSPQTSMRDPSKRKAIEFNQEELKQSLKQVSEESELKKRDSSILEVKSDLSAEPKSDISVLLCEDSILKPSSHILITTHCGSLTKIQHIINEIYSSELKFNENLELLIGAFLKNNSDFKFLDSSKRDKAKTVLNGIFDEAKKLLRFSKQWIKELEGVLKVQEDQQFLHIANCLNQDFKFFVNTGKVYIKFNKFQNSLTEKERKKFDEYTKSLLGETNKLPFDAVAATMFQRLPRYNLFIADLKSKAQIGSEEANTLEEAYKKTLETSALLNDTSRGTIPPELLSTLAPKRKS